MMWSPKSINTTNDSVNVQKCNRITPSKINLVGRKNAIYSPSVCSSVRFGIKN